MDPITRNSQRKSLRTDVGFGAFEGLFSMMIKSESGHRDRSPFAAGLIVQATRRFGDDSARHRADDLFEDAALLLKCDAHFTARERRLRNNCRAAVSLRRVERKDREPDRGQSGPDPATRPN